MDATLNIHKQIRNKVRDSNWRAVPYRNGGNPKDTFNEIVSDSFEEVKKLGINASHCRLNEMYNPSLGDLRRKQNYSALAPTNAMKYSDRHLDSDLRSYSPYKPKQSEWQLTKDKTNHPASCRWGRPKPVLESALLPLAPTFRRQYAVPADPTRYENFAVYWGARARGLDLSEPFLQYRHENYEIEESRRYQRLFWAPVFIPSQPTARHARQIIMTAY